MNASTILKKPKAFVLTVGAVNVAEGIELTTGEYLVVFSEPFSVRKMNEDEMVKTIEMGAKLQWT